MASVDLDRHIDYKLFYGKYLSGEVKSGAKGQCLAHCPFHRDGTPSFSFNTSNGKWRCYSGCGDGNAVSFYAKIKGIDTKAAYAELVREYAPNAAKPAPKKSDLPYSLKEYALSKHLPVDFLRDALGMRDAGATRVSIPYHDASGNVVSTRYRYHPESPSRFSWAKGSHAMLYGLDRIEGAERVCLCEGESDTQTLWYHDVCAVGIPGASTPSETVLQPLTGIPEIIVVVDADAPDANTGKRAGDECFAKVCASLRALQYGGIVRRASARDVADDCKDPSDIHVRHGDDAHGLIHAMLSNAQEVNLSAVIEAEQVARRAGLTDPPLENIIIPENYAVTDAGVSFMPDRGDPVVIASVPFIITGVMSACDDAGELLSIALRDYRGKWRSVSARRTEVVSAQGILKSALVAAGCPGLTSATASQACSYLAAFESANRDNIPNVRRIAHYGWQDDGSFFCGQDIPGTTFAPDGSMTAALDTCGSLESWQDTIGGTLMDNPLALFIACCALCAPLLRPCRARSFVVYNWGDSGGGKTAALTAALSVWGNPRKMQSVSLNATPTAVEVAASHFCDLPLGADERQTVTGKLAQERLESLVYMLCEERGKGRGAKDGGLRQTRTWRTVALLNGEQALAQSNTMTGVYGRTLELYGVPFSDRDDAASMYSLSEDFHGTAGRAFIRHISALKSEDMRSRYDEIKTELLEKYPRYNPNNVTCAALALYAWEIAAEPVFRLSDPQQAEAKKREMLSVVFGEHGLPVSSDADVVNHAREYLNGFVLANQGHFYEPDERMERYGYVENKKDKNHNEIHDMPDFSCVYFIKPKLEQVLVSAGYDLKKVMLGLEKQGRWETHEEVNEGKPRIRHDVRHRFNNQNVRVYALHLEDDFEVVTVGGERFTTCDAQGATWEEVTKA